MPQGTDITFGLLASTENEAAVPVLVAALDGDAPELRLAALRALLERRSPAGLREIVRRLDRMDDAWRPLVSEFRGRLSPALRDAILGSDATLAANACRAAVWFGEYELIPTLLAVVEDPANPRAELAAQTLLELADLLYEELVTTRDYRRRRDPQTTRRHVVQSLEPAVLRYALHQRPEVLEAFLVLASRDNATLGRVLTDPHHSVFVPLVRTLVQCVRPGVMRLLLAYLDDPHAPSAAISSICHRTDRKFVEHLLRKIGHEPSTAARQHLKHVEQITWVRDDLGLFDELDDAGQHAAVQLVRASGLARDDAFRLLRHAARQGKPAGRRAAIAALTEVPGVEANQLVVEALRDEDPQVQALAAGQLRSRGITGALHLLLELAESPFHVVRQAVRQSLGEFSFARFLAAFDLLDDEVRRSTGRIVRKVDPACLSGLRAELEAAVVKRRSRGLALAVVLDAVADVEESIVRLIHDSDHLVRVEAVQTLARGKSAAAYAALVEAERDSSLTVVEAARQARAQWTGEIPAALAADEEASDA